MRRLALLAVFAAACTPTSDAAVPAPAAPAELSAAALDSVKAVDAAFATAFNAKDTTAIFANYAEDARLMPQDSPILDMAAAKPVLLGFMAAGASNFVLTPTIVYGVGDLAYMVGTASYSMGGVAETVKYTEVLRRGADGKWRYVVDMFSNMAAPAAAPVKK